MPCELLVVPWTVLLSFVLNMMARTVFVAVCSLNHQRCIVVSTCTDVHLLKFCLCNFAVVECELLGGQKAPLFCWLRRALWLYAA